MAAEYFRTGPVDLFLDTATPQYVFFWILLHPICRANEEAKDGRFLFSVSPDSISVFSVLPNDTLAMRFYSAHFQPFARGNIGRASCSKAPCHEEAQQTME